MKSSSAASGESRGAPREIAAQKPATSIGVRVALTYIVLFLATFEIFFSHPVLPLTDSYYSLLLSQSILSRHTVALNSYSIPHVKPFSLPGFGANGYPYNVTFHG